MSIFISCRNAHAAPRATHILLVYMVYLHLQAVPVQTWEGGQIHPHL